jgi:hypothetical protein
MDRLIKAAWRAFWVGLGASAVLVSQSVLASPPASLPAAAPVVAPAPTSAPAARGPQNGADPVVTHAPRCKTVANVTRCS